MVVVNTASPLAAVSAPKPRPRKTRPSSSARAASESGANRGGRRARVSCASGTMAFLSVDKGQDRTAHHGHPQKGGIGAPGPKHLWCDDPLPGRIEHSNIGGSAWRERATPLAKDPRRLNGPEPHQIVKGDMVRLDQGVGQRKGEFEATQSECRRFIARSGLFWRGMRRVIGAETIECAVLDVFDQLFGIRHGPKRWVDLGIWIARLPR